MPHSDIRAELMDVFMHGATAGRGWQQLVIAVDLDRAFSHAELVDAVEGLVEAFPVLGCRYRRGFWRDRWTPVVDQPIESCVSVVEAGGDVEAQTTRFVRDVVEIEKDRPFKIALLSHLHGSRLLFAWAHVVGDANAGLVAIAEIARRLCRPTDPAPLTMARSPWQVFPALGFRHLPALVRGVAHESLRPLFELFIRPWTEACNAAPGSGRFGYRLVRLAGGSHERFAAACREKNATINDGLVAAALKLAGRRTGGGFTGAAYTLNLRRLLPNAGPSVANISSACCVTLRGRGLDDPLQTVVRTTSVQKQGPAALAFALLPAIIFCMLPHGLLRRFSATVVFRWILFLLKRHAFVTNVGAIDPYVAPFGDAVRDAWMTGPFMRGFPTPIALASGFRETVTVSLCTADDISEPVLDRFAEEWKQALEEVAERR
ncbi:MAG: hypothetical protein HY897_21730 [Deltaproteobacteria bacterium]|nr:hypothetical protein [Deltaproteobacteria bacterium]